MDLDQFLRIIRNMDRRPFKPHRYLALMAILDIIENQENQNEFYFDDKYKNYFINYFCKYHTANDNCNSYKPFFHLQNVKDNDKGFWFLKPKSGMEIRFKNLKTVNGPGQLEKFVEYGNLDQELFSILSDQKSGQESREKVRNVIKQCLEAGLQTNL